jgi:F-type H+-transporting ATPase subunit b
MEEILHTFGIDWRLIVIQVFNFVFLLGVLWYFLYTPILKLITEREEKIRKGLADADSAAYALKDADGEKNRIIRDAHTEASQIVSRGTLHAEVREKELFDEATEKVARHLANAESLAEEIKAKALKESETEIAKMAILGAEKILATELSK